LHRTLESRQHLSLTIDLRLPDGTTTAEVSSVGQKITMQVWAVVKGKDATGSNDGLLDAAGSFLSSAVSAGGAPAGNLSAKPVAPFNAAFSENGLVQDLNGDGNLDIGPLDPSDTSQFSDLFAAFAPAPNMQTHGTVSGRTNSFQIGTVTYTVTALHAGSTQISFEPAPVTGAVWSEDGNFTTSDDVGAVFAAGTAITLTNYTTPRITLSSKGLLSVNGTSGPDKITLNVRSGKLTAAVGAVSRVYATSKVKNIRVYGLGGDDTITTGKGVMACSIYGGDGNDTIYAKNGVADTIDGGTGTNRAQVDKTDHLTHIQKILK